MRNKLLALILLLSLSFFIMVVGTAAYLTDGAVSDEIVLNSGKLKIDGTRNTEKKVQLSPALTKISGSATVAGGIISNISPADILEAQVEVANSGDLPMYLGGKIVFTQEEDTPITLKDGASTKSMLSKHFKIKDITVKYTGIGDFIRWESFSSENDLPNTLFDFKSIEGYKAICSLKKGETAQIKISLQLDQTLDFEEANGDSPVSVKFRFDIKAIQDTTEARKTM